MEISHSAIIYIFITLINIKMTASNLGLRIDTTQNFFPGCYLASITNIWDEGVIWKVPIIVQRFAFWNHSKWNKLGELSFIVCV